jgi:integrase/recombinase XerD
MRDWQRAQEKIREWEARDGRTVEPEAKTIDAAWTEFLADIEARKLAESTIRKYKLLKRQMEDFAKERGFRFLIELDLPAVSQFRAGWKDGPRSSAKKLERLRAFLRFAMKRKWVSENPAADLRAPKVTLCPTLPFTPEEMQKIYVAIDKYKEEMPQHGLENARRLRGLVLLQRYSGLRISDVVGMETNRISGKKLFLYTAKTGVPVNTVLPDFVIKALDETPRVCEKYFFWSGEGKLDSIVRSWQNRLHRLFELAGIEDGHPHQFRDTFAVELLLSGVPIERVAILLGHSSVRITEKHYAPWVRARQDQLEADLTKAWSRDAFLISQTQGTPQVHAKPRRIN